MILLVIALVLAAAGLHATWNVLLKTSGDPLRVSTRAMSSAALIATPVAGIAWLLGGKPGFPAEAWRLVALSSMAELAYFVFLSEAYRRGDLSVVYPLARGTAPLLAVIAGVVVLGERLTLVETAGVICLLAGIWLIRRPVTAGSALVPALLTGVFIATYTTIDRVGVRLAPPWLYGWAIWVATALLLVAYEHVMAGRSSVAARSVDSSGGPAWPHAVAVGLLMIVGYVMVLTALSVAPLSIVAPLRESAIILVTGWGVWRLGERTGAWLRLGGALGIVAGIVLVALR